MQSNRTDSHDNAAGQLWLICRQKNGQHDTPTKEELSERGTKQLTTELCHFITSQPIPIYFDVNLKPTTESNRCCVETTLVGYVGEYVKLMCHIDHDHPN